MRPIPPPTASGFERLERIAPLGYFAMGVGWVTLRDQKGLSETMLAFANGSDWAPQPVTLHRPHPSRGYEQLPFWFSQDYDYHLDLAVGDLTGNGYDDVVVAVFAGKNQDLSGGGVKAYLGGPSGLDPEPLWLARGFGATGLALSPVTDTGKLDVLVSCLSEEGTIQEPAVTPEGTFSGRARLLRNCTHPSDEKLIMDEFIIDHAAARGAGDVSVADVDLDGKLDVIFAGSRTSVLFGGPALMTGRPWAHADFWLSEEEHPFSFTAQAFIHPSFSGSQLIVSSRGLFSQSQLRGRSIEQIETGLLIHRPVRGERTRALQHLAKFDPKTPELPAGLAVLNDETGQPHLVAGFLDARTRDILGAPLRAFEGTPCGAELPFSDEIGTPLPGGGLMAGRVVARTRSEGPKAVSEYRLRVGAQPQRVVCLPFGSTGELLSARAETKEGHCVKVSLTQTLDSSAYTCEPSLPPHARLIVVVRHAEEVEIAATSSSAWPPAGASGVWQWRTLKNENKERAPATETRRAEQLQRRAVKQQEKEGIQP